MNKCKYRYGCVLKHAFRLITYAWEKDLSVIKKLVICTACHGTLENCFRFVTNCLIVEEKIKAYREAPEIDSKGQIELGTLLKFTMRDVKSKIDNLVVIIKVEDQLCEEKENADEIGNECYIFDQMSYDDRKNIQEEIEHKIEFLDMDDVKFSTDEQFMSRNMLACKEEDVIKMEEISCGENELKMEDLGEVEDEKFVINEDTEIKIDVPDFIRLEDGVVLPQADVATTTLASNIETDLSRLYLKRTFTNKNVSTMYQCELCPFQTKYKRYRKMHLLKHKDSSEVTMYKCDSCSFQSKYKNGLRQHLLLHKNLSEITTYKCDYCLYETKYKNCLRSHLLRHRDPSEVTMFKCDSCLYQTKIKDALKKHLMLHKDPSEVKMYKCDFCSYQAKRKYDLKKHLILHTSPLELTLYKCESCPFQTKYRYGLQQHLLLHKNPSELTMYKCNFCVYQTKRKCDLKKHVILHKKSSEVTLYKCDSCLYQTRYKDGLKKHLMSHENSSEVTMQKCECCSGEGVVARDNC